MVTVVTRSENGIPLTHEQVDDNFTNLASAVNSIGADVIAEAVAAKDVAVGAAGSASASALSASNSANAASTSQGDAAASAESATASAISAAASAASFSEQLNAFIANLAADDGGKNVGFINTNLNQMAKNNKARFFPRWTAALARAKIGGTYAKIACVGDSTSSGVGSNPSSANTDCRRRAYPQVMANTLRTLHGLKATAQSIWCDGFEDSNLHNFDPRIAFEAGWVIAPPFVAGGNSYQDTTTTSPKISFTPDIPTDTLDIYYVKYSGYADFIVSSGGTFNGSASTSGPAGVGKLTVTRASSSLPWDIQKSNFTPDVTLQIVGFDAYVAADHNVSVWNMGASGSRVSNWSTGNEQYDFRNAIKFFAPDLTIINLTINDWSNNTPPAEYIDGQQLIIEGAMYSGDVLLTIGVPSNVGAAPQERQDEFAQYVRNLAVYNNLPLVDLSERWISQSLLPQRGLYFDGQHPSDVGYCDIGNFYANLIATLQ